jgi:hypothetical protein
MSYRYSSIRSQVFTEEGQLAFIKIRDRVHQLLDTAGAFSMHHAAEAASGDSWLRLACVDRLVELGEIVEVPQNPEPAGQDRIFRSKDRS